MASLAIRNLPDDVKRRFHQRAAKNGRSMKEEGRRLIIASVEAPDDRPSIGEMIYGATRPGFDVPEVPGPPASFAAFDGK